MEKVGELTNVKETTRMAQSVGLRAEVAASRRRFSALGRVERRQGEKKMGRGEEGSVARGGFLQLKAEARGRGERGRGGFGLAVSIQERKERGRRLGKKLVLTGGPHPSATSKRGGEGRGRRLAGGPQPRERGARRGGGGFGPKGRIERMGEKEIPFSFFLYQISN